MKIVTLLIFITFLLASMEAKSETKYFDGTYIFFGAEVTNGTSNVCEGESWTGGLINNDKLTSNMGVYQNLLTSGNFNIQLRVTHHSCLFNFDKPSYNAAGVMFELRIF